MDGLSLFMLLLIGFGLVLHVIVTIDDRRRKKHTWYDKTPAPCRGFIFILPCDPPTSSERVAPYGRNIPSSLSKLHICTQRWYAWAALCGHKAQL